MGISILVAVEGVGRLDGRLRRHGLERRKVRLQRIRRPRRRTTGWRRIPGRRTAGPLLFFGWIHSLSVLFGRGRRGRWQWLGVSGRNNMRRNFRNMQAGDAGGGDFRAMSNRAFGQTGW